MTPQNKESPYWPYLSANLEGDNIIKDSLKAFHICGVTSTMGIHESNSELTGNVVETRCPGSPAIFQKTGRELSSRIEQEIVIGQDHRAQCFYDGDRPGHHTGVVPALALHFNFISFGINGFLFLDECSHGFKGYPEVDIHAIGNTTLYTS